MANQQVSKEELICCTKERLKAAGFKKKDLRWTKSNDDFTMVFYIQGSQWDKNNYYIRPGIFINAIDPPTLPYGHIWTEISANSIAQIFDDLSVFFYKWTNKSLMKEHINAFLDWDKRNPVEKRRAGLVDYHVDPNPAQELLGTSYDVLEYILTHY